MFTTSRLGAAVHDDLAWATTVLGELVTVAGRVTRLRFNHPAGSAREFPPSSTVSVPCVPMSAADSVDILDLDELILFAFDWANRGR